jgi:hypothetical protein
MRFMGKSKALLATILSVAVLLTSSSAAFASGNSTTTTVEQQAVINKLNEMNQQSANIKAVNDKMDPYVKVVNNQYVLDIPENIMA